MRRALNVHYYYPTRTDSDSTGLYVNLTTVVHILEERVYPRPCTGMVKKVDQRDVSQSSVKYYPRTLPSLSIDPRVINDSDQVSGAKSISMSEN